MAIETIGVVGGGAWGTALAQVAAKAGRTVHLWAREPEVAESINTLHENTAFLKGVPLSPAVRATNRLDDLADADALLLVTPAQFLRATLAQLGDHLPRSTPLVLCSKGIEQGTGLLMTEVCNAVAGEHPLAVLSGPTFAAEVARGLPTAITLACADEALGARLTEAIGLPTFRPYWSPDLIGAEVGGAVKNVLAIACGIAEGKQLGENARAALITRGFAEMLRFGAAKGAQRETLSGLCGLGDLILTCSSTQSRNMSLGYAIGQGRRMNDILAERKTVAEGAYTAPVLLEAAQKLNVEMPITEAVVQLLYHDADVDTVIGGLLSRPFRPE
ncbi:NAD(P)H-dependent glycerol-3-phosphate dehydrogenase [Pedomonas sp. V897]|uniref:NAD(P)H-dependent glycerol-3-phosphate dehydrogenase n=1 Tax=Pedomonas sp. V897 TaxID=3446482 RepID=UPI003EDFFC21